MCTEVDVFITNYTLVDPEILELWIQGFSASEAVSTLNQRGLGQKTGASLELIASDVLDHYRTYSLLEKLLTNPNKLQEQLAFQIDPDTRQFLIESYYAIDDNVVRELLGKKLSSKHRKDLDEVAEKTGVPLKSCRRQFDNIKRIFKSVEEMPGPIVQNIQKLFYLHEDLARKYACIVFLACIRFETSKRRLQYLDFITLKQCTEVIMDLWTYNVTGKSLY
ncbi:acidic fibroblast growth factor intracellular-binding protein-like [Agrilus planipennis]|uniref:Acidic fibroblast growth factor intracellular-binding protein-like n=1 Tax=Agrilus planipennis TaxID=224129 RepID=A0A7F5QVL8_AGRPL|nr:acidic fibroblast growth factor intracellular-binding protein-like [Agrilus planipennis]